MMLGHNHEHPKLMICIFHKKTASCVGEMCGWGRSLILMTAWSCCDCKMSKLSPCQWSTYHWSIVAVPCGTVLSCLLGLLSCNGFTLCHPANNHCVSRPWPVSGMLQIDQHLHLAICLNHLFHPGRDNLLLGCCEDYVGIVSVIALNYTLPAPNSKVPPWGKYYLILPFS